MLELTPFLILQTSKNKVTYAVTSYEVILLNGHEMLSMIN